METVGFERFQPHEFRLQPFFLYEFAQTLLELCLVIADRDDVRFKLQECAPVPELRVSRDGLIDKSACPERPDALFKRLNGFLFLNAFNHFIGRNGGDKMRS